MLHFVTIYSPAMSYMALLFVPGRESLWFGCEKVGHVTSRCPILLGQAAQLVGQVLFRLHILSHIMLSRTEGRLVRLWFVKVAYVCHCYWCSLLGLLEG